MSCKCIKLFNPVSFPCVDNALYILVFVTYTIHAIYYYINVSYTLSMNDKSSLCNVTIVLYNSLKHDCWSFCAVGTDDINCAMT